MFKQISGWNNQIIVDEYVIMPNHFHCILIITDNEFEYPVKSNPNDNEFELAQGVDTIHELYLRGYQQSKSFNKIHGYSNNPTREQITEYRKIRRNMLINKIIGKFKMQVSKQINIMNNTQGQQFWQADFYDKIIKFQQDYFRIKRYIRNNPENWKSDSFNS